MTTLQKKQIITFCKKTKQIKLLYFFGSRAKGKTGPMSDYDFAAYIASDDKMQEYDIRALLIDCLTSVLKTDDVDVVPLRDTQSSELKYAIIKEGELIFERSPYRVLIEPRILNEYFDYVKTLECAGFRL